MAAGIGVAPQPIDRELERVERRINGLVGAFSLAEDALIDFRKRLTELKKRKSALR